MTDFVGLKEPTAVKLLIFVTYVTSPNYPFIEGGKHGKE